MSNDFERNISACTNNYTNFHRICRILKSFSNVHYMFLLQFFFSLDGQRWQCLAHCRKWTNIKWLMSWHTIRTEVPLYSFPWPIWLSLRVFFFCVVQFTHRQWRFFFFFLLFAKWLLFGFWCEIFCAKANFIFAYIWKKKL